MMINKSISRHSTRTTEELASESWYQKFQASLGSQEARDASLLLLGDLFKRNKFEYKLQKMASEAGILSVLLSDASLTHPELSERDVPAFLSSELS
jgi:hypothetical protein